MFDSRKVAESQFTPQELDHMRAQLDDPDVSPDVKNNFLYALSNAGRLSDAEIDRYAPQVGADAEDVRDGGEALFENMANARTALRKADLQNAQGNTNRGHDALNQGGFSTSDEIVDEAELVLTLFENFHPRYQKASGLVGAADTTMPEQPDYGVVTVDPSAGQDAEGGVSLGGAASYTNSGNDPHSIRSGLDEFRGIDFTAFRADAEMLGVAYSSVSDGRDALDSAWSGNTGEWTGDAKSAAEQVNNALVKGAGDLSQALRTSSDNLVAGIDAVQENVVNFAHRVLDVYGNGTVAELTPEQVDSFIRTVEELPPVIEELNAKIQELENQSLWDKFTDLLSNPITAALAIVSPVCSLIGYSMASEITQDNIREETAKLEGVLAESQTKLGEFCAGYQQKATEFHSHAATFVAGIDEAYSATIQLLGDGLDPDPFAEAEKGEGGENGTDPGQSGIGTGGGGGTGGGTGGGGGPSGGGGSIPGIGEPDTGTDGMNPVTGKPLETNPETGEPYPIDPETGEAIKDIDGREQLTVEQGDQKFTMTEPDDNGEMNITVEDGSGELSEYKLDFSEEAEGGDGDEADDSDFGPQGSALDETGKVYRPGPDGKIQIEDGNLKITAEQPKGPDGPTVVTVDNGEGEPVTYTLGDADKPESLLDENVTTMPAEADPVQNPRNFEARAEVKAEATGGDGGGGPNGSPSDGGGAVPTGGGGETGGDVGSHGAAMASSPNGEPLDIADPAGVSESSDSSSATHAAAVSDGGGGSSSGGGGGGELGGASEGPHSGGQTSSMSAGGGLATAPGGEAIAAQGAGGAAGAGAGGAGMMGGMGAMGGGGGGGQGGDQERSSSYRIDGDIFGAIAPETVRLSGSLADAPDVPVRFTR
ncbi:hypothetical protein ABT332_12590 [Saccharomonospora azurea]|uniref:hypothetical protein n=1 Tax=Saccharomonospora azurea TaxID=40988 RepID=UPI00331B1B42